MTILGTIAAMVGAIIITLFLGPYGLVVLISIIFGLLLSTHLKNKEMHADLQRIKEKLGIVVKDDFNMTDEEIEEELQAALKGPEDALATVARKPDVPTEGK